MPIQTSVQIVNFFCVSYFIFKFFDYFSTGSDMAATGSGNTLGRVPHWSVMFALALTDERATHGEVIHSGVRRAGIKAQS